MPGSLALQLGSWSQGVRYEIDFWNEWFSTKGLSWPEDYRQRFDPTSSLDHVLHKLARDMGVPEVQILDVGSGPATNVGKTTPGLSIKVRACDPLADQYGELYKRYAAWPPVRTEFAVAEDLSAFFPQSSFDIVYCRNALDHSFDPMRGIIEMLKVVRVGGWVVLRHHPNEAEREFYAGFHQFNFEERNGRFVIWNRNETFEPAKRLPVSAEVRCEGAGDVEVFIRKRGEFPRGGADIESRTRLGELFRGVVGVFSIPPGAGPTPDAAHDAASDAAPPDAVSEDTAQAAPTTQKEPV